MLRCTVVRIISNLYAEGKEFPAVLEDLHRMKEAKVKDAR
jgi:hypothetical protein